MQICISVSMFVDIVLPSTSITYMYICVCVCPYVYVYVYVCGSSCAPPPSPLHPLPLLVFVLVLGLLLLLMQGTRIRRKQMGRVTLDSKIGRDIQAIQVCVTLKHHVTTSYMNLHMYKPTV